MVCKLTEPRTPCFGKRPFKVVGFRRTYKIFLGGEGGWGSVWRDFLGIWIINFFFGGGGGGGEGGKGDP